MVGWSFTTGQRRSQNEHLAMGRDPASADWATAHHVEETRSMTTAIAASSPLSRLWVLTMRRGPRWATLRVWADSERHALWRIPRSMDDWAVMEVR